MALAFQEKNLLTSLFVYITPYLNTKLIGLWFYASLIQMMD